MQDADDFDAVAYRTVEYEVPLKILDPPYPHPAKAWMSGRPPLAHAGHAGDLAEGDARGVI